MLFLACPELLCSHRLLRLYEPDFPDCSNSRQDDVTMTDQEFREIRSMVERRVREARALRPVAQDRQIADFAKKRFDGGTDCQARPSSNGSRDPQAHRKS